MVPSLLRPPAYCPDFFEDGMLCFWTGRLCVTMGFVGEMLLSFFVCLG